MLIKPLEQNFGAIIDQVDLKAAPMSDIQLLTGALYQYGFLVINDQELSTEEYIDFGKKIGSIKVFVDQEYRHPEHPEIFVVSNVKRNGAKFGMDRVGLYWHTDCSFLKEPQPITMLHCQIAPTGGGETSFFDMRAFFDGLENTLKTKLRKLSCEHQGQTRYIITESDVGLSVQELLERDQTFVPPVAHPMVITHPFSEREVLYVNEGFVSKIIGVDASESANTLSSLFNLESNQRCYYQHKWRNKQLVIWDNRSLLHRANVPSPEAHRLMYRLGISDGSFFHGSGTAAL